MKTAVSIPDGVFADGERLAVRLQTSRSQLYARALAEFVARHDDDQLVAAMDKVIGEVGTDDAEATRSNFSREAARRVIRQVEW